MRFFSRTELSEQVFAGIILVALGSFAYYFTIADLEEVQANFNSRRGLLVKLLARELTEMLNKRADLTPRLSNLLSEEAVIYAIVQQPKGIDDENGGEILAKAENSKVSVGNIESIEAMALETSYLKFIPFVDQSGTIPILEAAIPLVPDWGKAVLRVGFSRLLDEERSKNVLFRNSIIFSTLFISLLAYWTMRNRSSSSFQGGLLGGTGILVLLLFLSTRFTIQNWYDHYWRQIFVQSGLSTAKILALSVKRFLTTGKDSDLRELQSILEFGESFLYFGIIKDERYAFHSNPSFFYGSRSDLFDVFVPVMDGGGRLGTIQMGLRNSSAFGPLSQLRNRLVLIFLSALILSLLLAYLLTRRVSKDISVFIRSMEQVTAGDFRQSVFLDREDEFGQMAQTYNFMLMGLRERDMLGKGLQHYVSKSIVDKTLKVLTTQDKTGEKIFAIGLYICFRGLSQTLSKKSAPEIFSAVRDLLDALKSSQMVFKALEDFGELPFSCEIVLHGFEVVQGAIGEEDESLAFIGEGGLSIHSLARVHPGGEILLSEETAYLIREVANIEEIEISTQELGHVRAFYFKGYKNLDQLVKIFPESSQWVKILVLKILKLYSNQEIADILIEWVEGAHEEVKYHILDVLVQIRPKRIIDFISQLVQKETNPRVLSKAIFLLGTIGNESHISLLAEKLSFNDRRVKANAIEALEAIGGKKVYEYLNLLVDETDNRVRANILIAMGKYGDLKVFDLLSRMIKDPDKNMRASAAYALGQLGMVQGVDPLISALSDKDLTVRRQVVASLTRLKADLEIEM
ncbi:HEAT repeat domain-containing protein [bacterium]|nr:HEAT repeat domain-containing protein [bacterium]